jgi:hypothetical protein
MRTNVPADIWRIRKPSSECVADEGRCALAKESQANPQFGGIGTALTFEIPRPFAICLEA